MCPFFARLNAHKGLCYLGKSQYLLCETALGWSDYRQGQYDKAMQEFQTAYGLAPAGHDAFAGMGMTLAKMGRCPEAIPHLEFALSNQLGWAEVQQALETCKKQR